MADVCSPEKQEGFRQGLYPTQTAKHFFFPVFILTLESGTPFFFFFFFNVQIGKPLTRKYFTFYGSMSSASALFLPGVHSSALPASHSRPHAHTQKSSGRQERMGKGEVSVHDF